MPTKISQLPEELTPNGSDAIPMFDAVTGDTRKITVTNLNATNVQKSGDTMTGKLVVPSLQVTGSPTNGYVLTSDASGNATWQLSTGGGGGGSGISRTISSVSTATSAGAAASTDYIYLVSGTTTLTLPTAVSNTNRYTVKNTGTGTVTVATTSAQTIDGSSTASLKVQNVSLDVISDGSNWRVI